MKHWKVWLALVVAVALAAAGFFVWRSRSTRAETSSLTQVVAVERGDLVASISPTGEVYAPRQAELAFDVTRLPLTELNVVAGKAVKQGDILARIDPASLERAVEQAQADLLSAQEALQEVQEPASELERQRARLAVTQAQTALEQARRDLEVLQESDTTAAESAVSKASFDLDSARLNLALTQASPTVRKNVRDLEYAEAWHERRLRDLEAQLVQGTVERDAVDDEREALADVRAQSADAQEEAAEAVEGAEDRLSEAEAALADARESLEEIKAGPTELELVKASDEVAQAEYDLARAEDDLVRVESGVDESDLQAAQTRYDAAQAALEEAQAALAGATMVAPFDGTVISVGAEAGDLVSSGTVVVVLADLSRLEVLATVDETEISQVQVGQEVEITFDAFPGKQFRGQVLEVPLEGTLRESVVTYEVPVSLEGGEGVALKSGMTANLKVVVGRREDVLLLPALAVQLGDSGNVVLVEETPGAAGVETPVEVGLSDGIYVEVLRGLIEGDRVVVQYQAQEETGFRFGMGGLRREIMGGAGVRVAP